MRSFTFGWLLSVPLAACSAHGVDSSPSERPGTGGSGGSSAASSGGSAASGWSSGGSGATLIVDAGSDTGSPDECAKASHAAEPVPLDLVIMLDHSSSMALLTPNGTLWASVTNALSQFVSAPSASGIGASLHFFPQPGAGGTSCDPNVYAMPAVAMQTLPAGAAAITAALAQEKPGGVTPTAPALEGAILYATNWLTNHPGHKVAVVLATDGMPTQCTPKNVPSIAQIADSAFQATPSIPTFVIGVGSQLSNLNAIAAAGGTSQAYLVDTNAQAGDQFLNALLQIQGVALGCEYSLPDGDSVDHSKVNVDYTPGGGSPTTIPAVSDASQCGAGGGWYYDNPAAPTKIVLCDATCKTVQGDKNAELEIVLGCATVIKPPT